MFILSDTPNKTELTNHVGKLCRLGGITVLIAKETKDTRTGSWRTGLKFHKTTYAVLQLLGDYRYPLVSFDYGRSWNSCRDGAFKSAGRNKIVLERQTTTEFAYDDIQRINRSYGM